MSSPGQAQDLLNDPQFKVLKTYLDRMKSVPLETSKSEQTQDLAHNKTVLTQGRIPLQAAIAMQAETQRSSGVPEILTRSSKRNAVVFSHAEARQADRQAKKIEEHTAMANDNTTLETDAHKKEEGEISSSATPTHNSNTTLAEHKEENPKETTASSHKMLTDVKTARQKALHDRLCKKMMETETNTTEHANQFENLDKWLQVTGYYDREHRTKVLRLHEAIEVLDKQLGGLDEEDVDFIVTDSKSKTTKDTARSPGGLYVQTHGIPNNNQSEANTKKRPASQDAKEDHLKHSRLFNDREKRSVWPSAGPNFSYMGRLCTENAGRRDDVISRQERPRNAGHRLLEPHREGFQPYINDADEARRSMRPERRAEDEYESENRRFMPPYSRGYYGGDARNHNFGASPYRPRRH
jgi:hypothetical protein